MTFFRRISRSIWRILLLLTILLALVLLAFNWAASQREVHPLGVLPEQGGRLIETTEGQMYILERGDPSGTPVLFAHGTAAWSGLWLPTLNAVGSKTFRTIGYDLPPFGFSGHDPQGDYSRQRQADRILALVQTLEMPPIVVAHSFGAGPVAEAVLRKPEAFAGLIIVAGAIGLNAHLEPSDVPIVLRNDTLRKLLVASTASNPLLTKTLLRSLIHVKEAASDEIIEILHQPTTRQGYTNAVTQWVPSLLTSPSDALSTRAEHWQTLALPTALIWGDQDTVTPLSQGRELHGLIPNAALFVLPDIGHIPQIEAFEVFKSTLLTALDSVTQ